jgi:hypothetical protein
MNVIMRALELTILLHRITEFFHIPDLLILGLLPHEGGVYEFSPFSEEIMWIFLSIAIYTTLGMISGLLLSTFQEIADFSDPPKAIQRLEERINALSAKNT